MPLRFKSVRLSFVSNLVLDLGLLAGAFLLIYHAKRRHLDFEPEMIKYIPLYLATWLGATLLSGKFKQKTGDDFLVKLKPFVVSILLHIGSLSILLYALKWIDLSRFIVLGSISLFFIFELLLLAISYSLPYLQRKEKTSPYQYAFLFFLFEFVLIAVTFLSFYFYKRDSLVLTDEYRALFLVIYFAWILIGVSVHKFRIPRSKRYLAVIWPFVKSFVIVLGLLSFFVFTFRVIEYSRLVLFGSMGIFFLFEMAVITIYYVYKKPQSSDEPAVDIFHAALLREPIEDTAPPEDRKFVDGKYIPDGGGATTVSIQGKLENVYLRKFPLVYRFLDENIDLSRIDYMSSEILSSSNPYNAEVLPDDSLNFFMNLHEMNDLRRINQYLIEVNKKLRDGGIFVGRFEPFTKRRQRFLNRYPYYLANIVYMVDFVWRRVFPKLPVLQKFYFAVTRGEHRVLSKAEGLGRLYYCGFEIVALREIGNFVYFAARKAKEPSTDPNPSYAPVFKMERMGRHGQPIYVYKFRTMHPYSEYLQDYVLRISGYSDIGKPAEDFRVTAWGKLMRRYWLDELPQLINVFRGEMRLVGVRPISRRFLSEFPEDVRDLRMKYKPSCIPAYVSLLKQSKDGFIEAETTYILEKEKSPVWTDVKYLYLAVYNIFTNKIRSA